MSIHRLGIGLKISYKLYPLSYRKLKTSLKKEVYLLPHTKLSDYWKEHIITRISFMYKDKDKKTPVGVVFNPEEFIPQYLERFLLRQELEGKPLPPGHYEVLFKVDNIDTLGTGSLVIIHIYIKMGLICSSIMVEYYA